MDDTNEPARGQRRSERPRDPAAWKVRTTERYWRTRPFEFRPGADFFATADPIVAAKRTLLGYDRLYALWQAIRNVAGVPGQVAEIGSYRGGSAHFIADAFVALSGAEVPMAVFDTFEGHPADVITEHDGIQEAGHFGATRYEDVRAYLSPFAQLRVYKGDVAQSLRDLPEAAYRLVHIDTDLYQPTRVCLEYFGRRMSARGVIVVDDYGSPKCPGVPKAISEYLERESGFHVWDVRTEQLILIRS